MYVDSYNHVRTVYKLRKHSNTVDCSVRIECYNSATAMLLTVSSILFVKTVVTVSVPFSRVHTKENHCFTRSVPHANLKITLPNVSPNGKVRLKIIAHVNAAVVLTLLKLAT